MKFNCTIKNTNAKDNKQPSITQLRQQKVFSIGINHLGKNKTNTTENRSAQRLRRTVEKKTKRLGYQSLSVLSWHAKKKKVSAKEAADKTN